MASTSGQEEFLAVIRKSQDAVIAAVRSLAEAVRTAGPKLPSVSLPFADKLPGPGGAVASAHDFAEHLLSSQRKFTEDLLKAKPEARSHNSGNTAAIDPLRSLTGSLLLEVPPAPDGRHLPMVISSCT